MKRLLWCMLVVLCMVDGRLLRGLEMRTTGTPDIALSRRIVWVRCTLTPPEVGLLHRGLLLSTDNAAVTLVRWHSDQQPTRIDIPSFGRQRRAYTGTFTLALELACAEGTPAEQCAQLLRTQVQLAGLMVITHKNGSLGVRAAAAQAPLVVAPVTNMVGLLPLRSSSSHDAAVAVPSVHWKSTRLLDTDYAWIRALRRAWDTVYNVIMPVSWGVLALICWVLYLIMLLLGYFCAVRWESLVQGAWWRELRRVGCFIGICAGIMWAGPLMGRRYALSSCAVLLVLGMLYALTTPPTEQVFLGRLKRLIGFIMGVALLPCVVRAWLLQWGL